MTITYKPNIPELLRNNPDRKLLLDVVPKEIRDEIRHYELAEKSYAKGGQ